MLVNIQFEWLKIYFTLEILRFNIYTIHGHGMSVDYERFKNVLIDFDDRVIKEHSFVLKYIVLFNLNNNNTMIHDSIILTVLNY